jgi:hypothetical protein
MLAELTNWKLIEFQAGGIVCSNSLSSAIEAAETRLLASLQTGSTRCRRAQPGVRLRTLPPSSLLRCGKYMDNSLILKAMGHLLINTHRAKKSPLLGAG